MRGLNEHEGMASGFPSISAVCSSVWSKLIKLTYPILLCGIMFYSVIFGIFMSQKCPNIRVNGAQSSRVLYIYYMLFKIYKIKQDFKCETFKAFNYIIYITV